LNGTEHNPAWCLEHAIISVFPYANCGVCLLHAFDFVLFMLLLLLSCLLLNAVLKKLKKKKLKMYT